MRKLDWKQDGSDLMKEAEVSHTDGEGKHTGKMYNMHSKLQTLIQKLKKKRKNL